MNKFYKIYRIISFFIMPLFLVSCGLSINKDSLDKTTISFVDSNRHYYPIPQGKKLTVYYSFKNTGKNPLAISEVQSSCGCAVASFSDRLIGPDAEGAISLEFNSNKNIGYVKIYVTVVANTTPSAFHTLTFDVNVVPNALYTPDYEEVHQSEIEKQGLDLEAMVEGDPTMQGYYIDSVNRR